MNKELLKNINDNGRIHMVPCDLNGRYILRFVICARTTTEDDVLYAWKEIQNQAESLLTNRPLWQIEKLRGVPVLPDTETAKPEPANLMEKLLLQAREATSKFGNSVTENECNVS